MKNHLKILMKRVIIVKSFYLKIVKVDPITNKVFDPKVMLYSYDTFENLWKSLCYSYKVDTKYSNQFFGIEYYISDRKEYLALRKNKNICKCDPRKQIYPCYDIWDGCYKTAFAW